MLIDLETTSLHTGIPKEYWLIAVDPWAVSMVREYVFHDVFETESARAEFFQHHPHSWVSFTTNCDDTIAKGTVREISDLVNDARRITRLRDIGTV